jgi:hypothetical protein
MRLDRLAAAAEDAIAAARAGDSGEMAGICPGSTR